VAAAHLAVALSKGGAPRLQGLYLHRNQIGDDGLTALTECCSSHSALRRLSFLQLSHNRVGDAGLTALAATAAAGCWPKLERLYINHNKYATDGAGSPALARVIDSGSLPALREVHVDDPEGLGITVTGMATACARHGVTLGAGRVLEPFNVLPMRRRGAGWLRVDSGPVKNPRK
jgi:hypothetical protein